MANIGTINNWPNLNVTGRITPDSISSGQIIFSLNEPPIHAGSPGEPGEVIIAPDFIYTCVAPHTWQRVATATW